MLSLVRSLKAPAPAGLAHANLYSTVSGLTRRTWRTGSHPAPQSVHDDVRAADADAGADTGAAPPLRRTAHKLPTPHAHKAHRTTLKKAFPEGWAPPRRLSREAMDGLRAMHAADPEMFATPVLAERFRISPEAVRRILKSRWEPTREQRDGGARAADGDREGGCPPPEGAQERPSDVYAELCNITTDRPSKLKSHASCDLIEWVDAMSLQKHALHEIYGCRPSTRIVVSFEPCSAASHASHALVPQKTRPFGGLVREAVVPIRTGRLGQHPARTVDRREVEAEDDERRDELQLHLREALPEARRVETNVDVRRERASASVYGSTKQLLSRCSAARRRAGIGYALPRLFQHAVLPAPPQPPLPVVSLAHRTPEENQACIPLGFLVTPPSLQVPAGSHLLPPNAMAQALIPQKTYEGGQGPTLLKSLCSFNIADCPALGISLDLLERFASLVSSQLVDADLPAFHDMDSEKVSIPGYESWGYQMRILTGYKTLTIGEAALKLTGLMKRACKELRVRRGEPALCRKIAFEDLFLVSLRRVSHASVQLTLPIVI
ncbi:hypothetical protein POSPLADRAFT_1047288 [Postia placenta MAD-698-R-SB12]|uniref:Required for respiratory growth protein 9, mitochondrial n=1 Tax=Postia placenta MAD-698-R-SB12 TaxID=670580 RepID=A0A1X6MX98_9APHY|nr:hypothetical protein POSPLADRAFT_1047288 [Postia placenta MAD-698-R-SB12]OSX60995.1 hypothetical protein POSPLADRAFT_1047288 [Postia placenta MAD-698-R-SB12]